MGQRLSLHEVLLGLGTDNVYYQESSNLSAPYIKYEPSPSNSSFADNVKYRFKTGWQVTVVDRDPDSLIPARVEGLPFARFDRFYRINGLNHFVFQLYY